MMLSHEAGSSWLSQETNLLKITLVNTLRLYSYLLPPQIFSSKHLFSLWNDSSQTLCSSFK